ncbi:tRNA (adenosine(37)-N6)-threonylcarbamoyltransferase complex dimerization subunit type 1 TsaB [bacterium]|nr:tRNA (adenosine(37)-N6)-threonylcarbamoyltransferase complex dimerization subunit type 1 TsaB [bacterium]
MLVLALDTSTAYVCLGLADEKGIRGETMAKSEMGSAYHLFPLLSRFLESERLDIKDIDGYAIGIGPGSFTGLRIALTAGKIFSYFHSKPIKGISSLLVLSYPLPVSGIKAVAIPAYGGEIYAAAYRDKTPLIEDTICTLPHFVSLLENMNEKVHLALHPSLHLSTIPSNISIIELPFPPRGGILAQLGRENLLKGEMDDPITLSPNYLRASQAERRLYGEGC